MDSKTKGALQIILGICIAVGILMVIDWDNEKRLQECKETCEYAEPCDDYLYCVLGCIEWNGR
tara:strand:- start:190 stop:378 length:189 start_codon:yes stop_codon:yes gene_type:complete